MIPAPCHQLGGMKISSQLANNLDYSSAEFGRFLKENISSLRVLRVSAVKISGIALTARNLEPVLRVYGKIAQRRFE
jgi:hypothetical protein